jgi:hypothetical protein
LPSSGHHRIAYTGDKQFSIVVFVPALGVKLAEALNGDPRNHIRRSCVAGCISGPIALHVLLGPYQMLAQNVAKAVRIQF